MIKQILRWKCKVCSELLIKRILVPFCSQPCRLFENVNCEKKKPYSSVINVLRNISAWKTQVSKFNSLSMNQTQWRHGFSTSNKSTCSLGEISTCSTWSWEVDRLHSWIWLATFGLLEMLKLITSIPFNAAVPCSSWKARRTQEQFLKLFRQ